MPKKALECKQNVNKLKIRRIPAASLERDSSHLDQVQMQVYCGW